MDIKKIKEDFDEWIYYNDHIIVIIILIAIWSPFIITILLK